MNRPGIYNTLAPIYDNVMSHVKYDLWFDLIVNISKKYLPKSNIKIFEMGGGTGSLGTMLLSEGFSYLGSDLSFKMCLQAQKKNIPFLCADARSIPLKTFFDIIIFLYDGINYLQNISDYTVLFSEAQRLLGNDGLFLFDITTETNSISQFSNYLDFEDFGTTSYIRHSYYNKTNQLQYNDFTIFTKVDGDTDTYRKSDEAHVQKIISVKNICRAIPKGLFEIIGIWDGFSFKRFTPRSERIHFLLRKI